MYIKSHFQEDDNHDLTVTDGRHLCHWCILNSAAPRADLSPWIISPLMTRIRQQAGNSTGRGSRFLPWAQVLLTPQFPTSPTSFSSPHLISSLWVVPVSHSFPHCHFDFAMSAHCLYLWFINPPHLTCFVYLHILGNFPTYPPRKNWPWVIMNTHKSMTFSVKLFLLCAIWNLVHWPWSPNIVRELVLKINPGFATV